MRGINPKVSVAIITYNHEDYIAEAIESVLDQSYKYIEIVVADDGSNDNTPAIINDYACKHSIIKPVLAKENKGIPFNVNQALKLVEGEYLAFLSGDDLMLPNKIEKQVEYLNMNVDIIGCFHDMEVFDSSTEETLGCFSELYSSKKVNAIFGVEFLFDDAIALCPSGVMLRKDYIPALGFDTRLKYLNEYLFYVEVFRKGKAGYINEVLGRYRRHSKNVTGSSDIKEIGGEELYITLSIVMARYPELYRLVKRKRAAAYLTGVLKSVKEGDKTRARNISKALISDGTYIRGLGAYALSIFLSERLANMVYSSKYRKRLRDLWRRVIS